MPEQNYDLIAAQLNETLGGSDTAIRLNESEVYRLLQGCGVRVCPSVFLPLDADAPRRAEWGAGAMALADDQGRLLLKIVGRDILHKSDVGGVRVLDQVTTSGVDTLVAAAAAMVADVEAAVAPGAVEGVLAAAFVPHIANRPGQEVLLSLRQDPAFGPVVVVGIGGLLTEWYGRGTAGASRLIFPAGGLRESDVAEAMLAHPLLSLLCAPSRLYARPPLSPSALARSVCALGGLAAAFAAAAGERPTLEEIEINPAVAVDGELVAIDGVGLVSRRVWPAHRRPLARIGKLLRPRSAVVLGVSARAANPGRIILQNLLRSPGVDREKIFLVHPKESVIDGVPCYGEVSELPEKVDLAVVCIPAEGARDAIADLIRFDRAESIILIPGGFAEAGQGDLAAEIESIIETGHSRPGGGPVLVGGNCLGIVSRDSYNTFFLPGYKLPFAAAEAGDNLALVSQSGAYLVTFASNYDGVINPRASISLGNQMDLTVADFVSYFLDQEEVDVIACYVEGFRLGDGARFLASAKEAKLRGKHVIIYKAGRTPLGAKAAASHTASLAGDYDVARSCLEDAGVVVAEELVEFESLIKTFTMLSRRRPAGPRVGIISNAGFECTAVNDSLGVLRLAEFDAATTAVLDESLPSFAHRANPVDATPMAGTEAYSRSVKAIMDSPEVDCGIIASVPVTGALDNLPAAADGSHPEDLAAAGSQPREFVRILSQSQKPAVVVVDSGPLYDPMVRLIEAAGIPVFRKIDQAARAFSRFVDCLAPTDSAR